MFGLFISFNEYSNILCMMNERAVYISMHVSAVFTFGSSSGLMTRQTDDEALTPNF